MNVNRKWWRSLLSISMVLMLVLAACSSDGGDGSQGAEESTDDGGGGSVAGSIVVSGSSTVEPITSLVAEDFAAQNPDFDFSVDGPGTGDGFALFCNGETDISDASRPINEEEVALCEEAGITYVEVKIGIDGISVITSHDNDAVTCLSLGDLYALLGPESQGFDNWSAADDLAAELDGGDFGTSNAPFPDAALDITAPGEESGTYDSFLEIVFGDIAEAREQEEVARPDYTASADDNVIIEGISGSETSLGWVGFAFYEENTDTVKALEVDGGDGCVAPTAESIASNEYPISRDLFIYVNSDAAAENEAVSAFVDYYLSDEGIAAVEEAGYVALETSVLDESRSAWGGR